MRMHLNSHCLNRALGSVPQSYLQEHCLTHCSFCQCLMHTRYGQTCVTCRPAAQAAASVETLRARLQPPPGQVSEQHNGHALPTLDAVHTQFVPTIRHVPKELRALWARCLARTVAATVWNNTLESWTELQMLAKCVLCAPPRAGEAHKSQRVAFTRLRLNRWLAGERGELWHDLPQRTKPRSKHTSEEGAKTRKAQRCVDLCREGGYDSACKAHQG